MHSSKRVESSGDHFEYWTNSIEALFEDEDQAGSVHVVLGQFSFEMQYLLDDFMSEKLSVEKLIEVYEDVGTEGHDIENMRQFLEVA